MSISKEDVKALRNNGEVAVTNCSVRANDEARDEISRLTAEFLARGNKIDVRPGFERLCDDSKPVMTINVQKMNERENRERMKKQAASFYKNGKVLDSKGKKSGWRDIQDKRSASADEQGNW